MALQAYYPPWLSAGQTKLDDVGQGIVNAAFKGAEIANRRQALEEQMQRLNLELENQRENRSYRDAELDLRGKEYESLRDYRLAENKIRGQVMDQRNSDRKLAMDQFSALSQGAADIDKDDPDAMDQYWEAVAQNPYGAETPGGRNLTTRFASAYNTNAVHKTNAFTNEFRAWQSDTKKSVFNDYPGDWSILLDPGAWQQQYGLYDKSGKFVQNWDPQYAPPEEGQSVKPTENKFHPYQVPDPNNPGKYATQYLTKPGTLIDSKLQQYQGFQDRFSKLPQQQAVPGAGVYPQTSPNQFQTGGDGRVAVVGPDGKRYRIRADQAQDAISNRGFTYDQQ